MKYIKDNIIPIVSMAIVLFFLMIIMIVFSMEPFGNRSFVIGDCMSYIYPYLMVLREKLRSGDSLLYYWNSALGDGFLPTYFYAVSSPLNLLVVFVSKNSVRSFINFTIVFRIILSAGAFGFYISKTKTESENKFYMIPLSCAYALSGFVLGFYDQSMWLDSYMLFPLIMYGYDRMVTKKKPAVYVLSLALSAICNFYMTFIIAVFLILWFLIGIYESFKDFIKKGLIFAGGSILAMGMGAFPLVISAAALLDTRVGDSEGLKFEWFGNIFNIIRYQFFLNKPFVVYYDNNVANVYAGTFVILLFFVYVFSEKLSVGDKIRRLILLMILLISMNESVLNYVWNGFHFQNGVPNRFSFLYIFLMLITACDAVENFGEIKRSIASVCVTLLSPMIVYFFVDFDGFVNTKIVLVVSLIVLLIYSAIFLIYVLKNNKKILYVFSVVMLIELIIQTCFSFDNTIGTGDYNDSLISSAEEYINQNQNSEMNRSKVVGMVTYNNELLLNLYGVNAFNGFTNNRVFTFLNKCGYFAKTVEIKDRSGYRPLDDILGITDLYRMKDVYGLEDDYFQHLSYEKAFYDDNLTVYKNNNACALGFGIDNKNENIELGSTNCFENINKLTNNMTGCGNILEEISPVYDFQQEGYSVKTADTEYVLLQCIPQDGYKDPYVKLSFTADRTGEYNMLFNFQNSGFLNISVNGIERRHDSNIVSGGVFSLGDLKEGDRVDLIIGTTHLQVDGLKKIKDQILEIHMAVVNEENYNQFISKVHSNEMNINRLADNHLVGNINLDKNQMLMTTIPFDDGWHIYENGKELKKIKYADVFIGVELDEGQHEIEFKYIPKGFYPGIIISVLSWILFVILLLIKKQNDTFDKEDEIVES